ncbi:phosphate ABC transporter substrate-binding protein PstS [Ornithinimicrobium sufpigmenti]|uniref:phosphate ABC transporter substrate-binding protein PstS n=1 Tax=Ornithinimicrobium sufpigmenti TaxID=2508882 RepID=UPI001EDCFCC2|nr:MULTISPECIES: phosphate ABC transporter substrate-binding protein PstS [unclassified Ornithinimicrobium]
MTLRRFAPTLAIAMAASLTLAACGNDNPTAEQTPAEDTAADAGTDADTDTDAATGDAGGDASGGDLTGSLAAAGASAQNAAMTAWISAYGEVQPGVQVTYDSVGSGAGVTSLGQGAVDFAGSDSYLNEERREAVKDFCGDEGAINLPVYVSPIAVAFNLEGVDSLNLNPETIAKIFNQDITRWNDPEIAEQNPDADLPDERIVPVNRSDDSGTTDNFTKYLAAAAGDAWPHEAGQTWPVAGGEAGAQTAGVVSILSNTPGTIGYSDASAVEGMTLVNVGVGDEYVELSPEAAAQVVEASPLADTGVEGDLAVDLDYATTESGAYPIVLISYHVVCKNYQDADKANLVKDFISYVASPEGQDVAADGAGSAPISDGLREQVLDALGAVNGG